MYYYIVRIDDKIDTILSDCDISDEHSVGMFLAFVCCDRGAKVDITKVLCWKYIPTYSDNKIINLNGVNEENLIGPFVELYLRIKHHDKNRLQREETIERSANREGSILYGRGDISEFVTGHSCNETRIIESFQGTGTSDVILSSRCSQVY